MTRNAEAALVYTATIAAAALAAALVSTGAYAEGPAIDNTPFVSSTTRAEVKAQPKTPLIGGDPSSWAPDMVRSSALSAEQVRGAYKMSREEVNALTSEDSGSAYLARQPRGAKATMTMGGSAEDPSNRERDR